MFLFMADVFLKNNLKGINSMSLIVDGFVPQFTEDFYEGSLEIKNNSGISLIQRILYETRSGATK